MYSRVKFPEPVFLSKFIQKDLRLQIYAGKGKLLLNKFVCEIVTAFFELQIKIEHFFVFSCVFYDFMLF